MYYLLYDTFLFIKKKIKIKIVTSVQFQVGWNRLISFKFTLMCKFDLIHEQINLYVWSQNKFNSYVNVLLQHVCTESLFYLQDVFIYLLYYQSCLYSCSFLAPSVTSSEKVDKAQRYADFTLLSVPYPGTILLI